jgi:hypothetical protein
LDETPFETVSWRISPNGPNGRNIPKSNMLVEYFLPYGKNNPIGFYFPWDFSWDS